MKKGDVKDSNKKCKKTWSRIIFRQAEAEGNEKQKIGAGNFNSFYIIIKEKRNKSHYYNQKYGNKNTEDVIVEMPWSLKAERETRGDPFGACLLTTYICIKLTYNEFIFAMFLTNLTKALKVRENVILLFRKQVYANQERLGIEWELPEIKISLEVCRKTLGICCMPVRQDYYVLILSPASTLLVV